MKQNNQHTHPADSDTRLFAKHPDYKFLAHKSPGVARYAWWILVFTMIASGFALLIINNNGNDSDLNFVAEALGIGFCVNIIASIVIMVFFDRRDRRIRAAHERSAARRVALEIVRYLRANPVSATTHSVPNIRALRDRLEYLLDTLHFELHDDVKRDIMHFLHTTEDDAAGTDPDKTALNEIEAIAAALKRRYGEEIFATARKASQ
jgi:hypothetical protein